MHDLCHDELYTKKGIQYPGIAHGSFLLDDSEYEHLGPVHCRPYLATVGHPSGIKRVRASEEVANRAPISRRRSKDGPQVGTPEDLAMRPMHEEGRMLHWYAQ